MSESSVLPSDRSHLLPRFEHATVADAMHPGILSCDAEATLTDVARIMSTNHVHCVAVGGTTIGSGLDSRVWAIISDLDLLAAALRPEPPDTAAALAQHPVVRVETTDALRDAAELMLTKRTSHAVVVSPETRHPVGILSTLDIAAVLARRDTYR
jgi:CBS domain-containing protein